METDFTSRTTTGNGSDRMSAGTQSTTTGAYNQAKSGATQRTAASLRSDLSNMKNELDALVNRSSSMSDEELTREHAQMMAKFSSMRYAAKGIATEASRQFNRSMETTTEYVKGKPMQSVAAAVGTGLLLGLLFGRR